MVENRALCLPSVGKPNILGHHHIFDAQVKVTAVNVSASLFGLAQQDPITTEEATSRASRSRHAALFKGQLGLAHVQKELGITRTDLPLKAILFKVSREIMPPV